MKKFIIKIALLSFPLLLPVILFVIIDPFMIVMGNRGNIRITNEYNITWNRDFQSTELFIKNYNNLNYNSFILGNSRSFFYNIKIWKKYIEGNCFHFNSSVESLFGIERKLKFLDENNVKIKNVLIILDYSTLVQTNNSNGHLFVKHPLTSGESYISFYTEMYKGFFPKPFIAYVDLFLTGKRKSYMSNYGIRENVWKIDLNSNQLYYFLYDSIIEKDLHTYYESKEDIFYHRDSVQLYSEVAIGAKQKELLLNIKSIFSSQKTNYKLIINPLYDQFKINSEDINYLNNLFGNENVFDFSGINEFTKDYKNYYETSHYRPHVAKNIMEVVYDKK